MREWAQESTVTLPVPGGRQASLQRSHFYKRGRRDRAIDSRACPIITRLSFDADAPLSKKVAFQKRQSRPLRTESQITFWGRRDRPQRAAPAESA